MGPRYLINADGAPFKGDEIEDLTAAFESLSPAERKEFRDANADAIARHSGDRILIVSGPGTGKSTLFKQRIQFWLEQNPYATILALSFVRKLVADLSNDIRNDAALGDQTSQVDVQTLHKYARSVVEQNHGTSEWGFAPHFRIIGQTWKTVVWCDALWLENHQNQGAYSWEAFEKQLHDDRFEQSEDWIALRHAYFTLCKFYNAAGFSDLILRARDALTQKPDLSKHDLFIFDEYQDFNTSEENLLKRLTDSSKGTLLVGDDDQVLYETLKSGKASLIRAIYKDTSTVNAMLPFCGRCDYHIARAASHFIKQSPDAESIEKIYEPMSDSHASLKVQVVACATPTTAVDYIRKFIEGHRDEIERRRTELAEEKAKDAFLLILSPSKGVDYYKPRAKDELVGLAEAFRDVRRDFSNDYYRVLNYFSLAGDFSNNFVYRKVLYYEHVAEAEVVSFLKICLAEHKPLSAIDNSSIKEAARKALAVQNILTSEATLDEKIEALTAQIQIENPSLLRVDLDSNPIDKERNDSVEHEDEEQAELEELEVKQMSVVELMTIVGSKGLSADHVIIVGFDNVNMGWVTRNAFYVAMTRARKSLHLITALKARGATRAHDFLGDLPDANLEFYKYTKGKRLKEELGSRADINRYVNDITASQSRVRR